MSITTIPCRAVLTSGSQHDDVHVLGQLLAALGFETSSSRGENPFGIVDETILSAVALCRQTYGIPDEDAVPGVPEHERRRWIGPNLWEGLLTPANKPRLKKSDAAA